MTDHPQDPHQMVGQRVHLKTEEREYESRLGKRQITIYRLDDPEMEAKMRSFGHDVRILLRGSVYSADVRVDRLNFRIDEEGVITGIFYG